MQVLPGLLEGLHGKPSVRIGADSEGLDLLVKGFQLVEVFLSSGETNLELRVSLAQRSNFLNAGRGRRGVMERLRQRKKTERGISSHASKNKGQAALYYLGEKIGKNGSTPEWDWQGGTNLGEWLWLAKHGPSHVLCSYYYLP